MSESPAGPNYAALQSMNQHSNHHSSEGGGGGIASSEGGKMIGDTIGGSVDLGAISGSLVTPGSGSNMDELFSDINNGAALGSLEIQDALNTLGPTTTEGLKYANDYHNANFGNNVQASNIALPGATEAKDRIGIPRG